MATRKDARNTGWRARLIADRRHAAACCMQRRVIESVTGPCPPQGCGRPRCERDVLNALEAGEDVDVTSFLWPGDPFYDDPRRVFLRGDRLVPEDPPGLQVVS